MKFNLFIDQNKPYHDNLKNLRKIWRNFQQELDGSVLSKKEYIDYMKRLNEEFIDDDDDNDDMDDNNKNNDLKSHCIVRDGRRQSNRLKSIRDNITFDNPVVVSDNYCKNIKSDIQSNFANYNKLQAAKDWRVILSASLEFYAICGSQINVNNINIYVQKFLYIINLVKHKPIDFDQYGHIFMKIIARPMPDKLHLELNEIVSFWEPYNENVIDFEIDDYDIDQKNIYSAAGGGYGVNATSMIYDDINNMNKCFYTITNKFKQEEKMLYIIVNYHLISRLIDTYLKYSMQANYTNDKTMQGSGYLKNLSVRQNAANQCADQDNDNNNFIIRTKRYKNNIMFMLVLLGCNHALGHLELLQSKNDNAFYHNHTRYNQLSSFATIKYLINL